ncbi:unnamed protein product [Somion occarium]|uniref:F-box domain-containing protein n=1 Tax=Somion occarium TaxID=3059160 RepID=A0ABP1EA62_9APHY
MELARLPPELIDIVQHIAPDVATLKSCSLTCKEWFAICRLYIFRRVTLNDQKTFCSLETLIEATPAIGPLIRHINIEYSPARGPFEEVLNTQIPGIEPIFDALHMHLTTLCTVRLCSNDITLMVDKKEWDASLFSLAANLHTVHTLIIDDFHMDVIMFQEIMCAFPNIRNVKLWDCSHDTERLKRRQPVVPCKPRFTSLEVRFTYSPYDEVRRDLRDFLPFILSAEPTRILRSLALKVWPEDVADVVEFLDALGARLEELRLEVMLQGHTGNAMSLRANTNLRSLILVCPESPETYNDLTATISSLHIRRLEYHVYATTDFMSLATTLDGVVFTDLEELCFVCLKPTRRFKPDVHQRVIENVDRHLSAFHKHRGRDILRFVDAEWDGIHYSQDGSLREDSEDDENDYFDGDFEFYHSYDSNSDRS